MSFRWSLCAGLTVHTIIQHTTVCCVAGVQFVPGDVDGDDRDARPGHDRLYVVLQVFSLFLEMLTEMIAMHARDMTDCMLCCRCSVCSWRCWWTWSRCTPATWLTGSTCCCPASSTSWVPTSWAPSRPRCSGRLTPPGNHLGWENLGLSYISVCKYGTMLNPKEISERQINFFSWKFWAPSRP